MRFRLVLQLLILPLPWTLRRRILNRFGGYEIHPEARIGLSLVAPTKRLSMAPGSWVGHLNFVRGMDTLELHEHAFIGQLNWIYGLPPEHESLTPDPARQSRLLIEYGGAITRRHMVDCSDLVTIGRNSFVGGYHTQIITHGIDTDANELRTRPVTIGPGCVIGTRCVLVAGAHLPGYCLLGAGSSLHKRLPTEYRIYSGVPPVEVASLNPDGKFFRQGRPGGGHRFDDV